MTQPQDWRRRSPLFLMLVALCLSLAALFIATPAESRAKKTAVETTEPATEAPVAVEEIDKNFTPKQRTVSLTFKQMGAWSAIKLRGVDGAQTLTFQVRSDEVVVAAKLRISYDYSPALIPELSHLKISLNDRIAMVESLPKDKGVGNNREINLDPRLFADVNNLRFNLIGHYTRQCEDPNHSSLWLTLSDLGRLELTLAPVTMANDLKNLPAPFADKHETTLLKLPFVFAKTPSMGALKAAGVVASWFGIQTKTRGAQFPVSLSALPDGNAVVFLQGSESVDGIRATGGATVSVQSHPTNAQAKLLVVSGASDEDLARAARAIVLFSMTLTGPSVSVTKETEMAPRKPYDAPAWVRMDRPVKFGELARLDELRIHGYYPEVIRLNYRVSPDLFTWRTPGAPLKLKYRATRLPMHDNSSLNVSLNANFIQAVALNHPSEKTEEINRINPSGLGNPALREEVLSIPPYAPNGRDQLQLSYYFDVIKQGECQNMPPDNLEGSVDAESTVDFSIFPHYVAMPNLAYFANIGFPFTRMADLSETAVVLSDTPNADELSTYLSIMGRMGEATGYPSLRHAVVSASNVETMSARDLIVVGSASSQSLMAKWADHLPMVQNNGERKVREADVIWRPSYRWEQQEVQTPTTPKSNLNLTGAAGLTTLMAFESPLQAARSVVFVYADKAGDLRKISDVLTDPERIPLIQGDFVVVDDKSVTHAKGSDTYYLGSLPALDKFRWFFSDQPLLLGLIGVLLCTLVAAIAYRPLRHIVAKRFKKTPPV